MDEFGLGPILGIAELDHRRTANVLVFMLFRLNLCSRFESSVQFGLSHCLRAGIRLVHTEKSGKNALKCGYCFYQN